MNKMSSANIDFSQPRQELMKITIGITLALTVLSIVQDLLQTVFRHSSFYLSESLLFRSVWLLFIPIAGLQLYALRFLKSRMPALLNITVTGTAAIFLHIIAWPFLVYILSVLCFDHVYPFRFVLAYTLGEDLYKYILIYTALAIVYGVKKRVEISPVVMPATLPPMLLVGTGRQKIPVNIPDIISINTASPYVAIQVEGKKYLHAATLKNFAAQLPPGQFIRIHKSGIVNMDKLVSFQSRQNGDYDLTLVNGSVMRVSRTYAPSFKERLQQYSIQP